MTGPMRGRMIGSFQVEWDGATVWVNASDGSCVGRFSKFGIDAHRTVSDQIATGEQCIECTHEQPDPTGWARFLELMQIHYDVPVPAAARPAFLTMPVT